MFLFYLLIHERLMTATTQNTAPAHSKIEDKTPEQSRHFLFRVIRVCGGPIFAAAILISFGGLYAPSGDSYAFLPRVFQVENPNLYANDLAFGPQDPQYEILTNLFFWLGRLMPLEYVEISLSFLSLALLFFSMARLASLLGLRPIPILVMVALLLTNKTHLIGGHHLALSSFYPSHVAFASTILAISFIVERRQIAAAFCVSFCFLAYPLIGLYAMVLFCVSAFFIRSSWRQTLAGLAIQMAFALIIALPSILSYSSGIGETDFDPNRAIKIWTFIRSPHHLLPSFFWPDSYFKLWIITLFAILFHLEKNRIARPEYRTVFAIFIVLMLWVGIATFNNHFFISKMLFLANPWKPSPLILGIIFCWAAILLQERFRSGFIFSSSLALCAPTPRMFFVFMLMICIISIMEEKTGQQPSPVSKKSVEWHNSLIAQEILLAVLCIVAVFAIEKKNDILFFLQISGIFAVTWFLVRAFGVKENRLKYAVIIALISRALMFFMFAEFPAKIQINTPEPAWQNMCQYVSENIPENECVIIPPDNQCADFQYLSKRAAFASWKHFSRHLCNAEEWLRRMCLLKVLPQTCLSGKILETPDKDLDYYAAMSENDFLFIVAQYPEVHHCIVKKTMKIPLPESAYGPGKVLELRDQDLALRLPLAYENADYWLYRISDELVAGKNAARPSGYARAIAIVQNDTGLGLMQKNHLEAAKKNFDLAVKMDPASIPVHYNMACFYSRTNQIDKAMVWLKKAVALGFNDWKLLENDHDIANLRNSSLFKKIKQLPLPVE